MNTVKATTKYGGSASDTRDGFKLHVIAEISDEQRLILDSIGLQSVMYRGGASVLNEALGVRSNSEAEFSEAQATKAVKALIDWCAGKDSPLEGGFKLQAQAVRHVHGEGQAPKYAEEKAIVKRHIESKDIVTWASDTVGFTGEGDLDTENVEFLKAVKAFKQRLLKSA